MELITELIWFETPEGFYYENVPRVNHTDFTTAHNYKYALTNGDERLFVISPLSALIWECPKGIARTHINAFDSNQFIIFKSNSLQEGTIIFPLLSVVPPLFLSLCDHSPHFGTTSKHSLGPLAPPSPLLHFCFQGSCADLSPNSAQPNPLLSLSLCSFTSTHPVGKPSPTT